jgi:hypothetical protein
MALRCHAYWAGTAGAAAQAAKLHIMPIIHANRIGTINARRIIAEKRKLFGFTLAAGRTAPTMRHALDFHGPALGFQFSALGC